MKFKKIINFKIKNIKEKNSSQSGFILVLTRHLRYAMGTKKINYFKRTQRKGTKLNKFKKLKKKPNLLKKGRTKVNLTNP